ncbi:metal-dependent phosphohydrolase [Marinobacterium zhoushanense]|uniref:Metal-dependent phosphohydrolase n=1 Tax=Marinobacterium zhoushanense TaxID=1679163 RepID=A0ABQ1KJE5_9GAMM|nr:HD domain-containing protein [Marinobacterium zhoushanense]GGB97709.1 metal-dependent phosphohydrolase [Marinobacterium zhoushanense]
MQRFDTVGGLKLAELIAALSHALDMTEGQPAGHCMRCCWIGMRIAEQIGLPSARRWELYYTLLLKDLGCSSNAARICELYRTDDLRFKHDFKQVDGSLSQVVRFVLGHTGLTAGVAERFRTLLTIIRNGDELANELIQTRCERGAAIARQLRFPEPVAQGIHALDEHWNGGGRPDALSGESIPLYARIALLAQVVDVFHSAGGVEAALDEARARSGSWFDPTLVDALVQTADDRPFWSMLASDALAAQVMSLEPAHAEIALDDDYMDEIAAAFGQVVDSKSPYTAGHSERVGLYTDLIAEALDIEPGRRRWLKRGALLHDIGKLGVSNSILDKPGKLDDQEWVAMRDHARFTEEILSRISAFSELARVSAAHHERLDGKGYPRGVCAEEIALETRIITTADIFDAITADRPYRAPIPVPKALEIMQGEVGTAIDGRCFEGLKLALQRLDMDQQVPVKVAAG